MKLASSSIVARALCLGIGLVGCLGFGWPFDQELFEADKVPHEITVDPAELEKLPEALRAEVQQYLDQLKVRELFLYQTRQMHLPVPLLQAGTQVLLLKPFDLSDIREDLLASSRSESGERLRLGDEPQMLQTLDAQAIVKVPSRKYPGQFHIYQARFVPGQDHIQAKLQRDLGLAEWNLRISVPRRLLDYDDGNWSVWRGVKEFAGYSAEMLADIPGLKTSKTYSHSEVVGLVEVARRKFIQSAAKSASARERLGIVPDLALYDTEFFNTSVQKHLERIVQAVDKQWERGGEAKARAMGLAIFADAPQGERAQGVEDYVALTKDQALAKALEQDSQLIAVSQKRFADTGVRSEIGQLLANRVMARRYVLQAEQSFAVSLKAKVAEIQQEVATEHAELVAAVAQTQAEGTKAAKGDAALYLDGLVAERAEQWFLENRLKIYPPVLEELQSAGLTQEAFFLEQDVEFLATRYEEVLQSLDEEAKEIPAHTYTHEFVRWLKPVAVLNEDTGKYEAEHSTQREVNTLQSFPLLGRLGIGRWRLSNMGWRTVSAWKLFLRGVGRSALVGPFSLKALVAKDAYASQWTVDAQSGDVIPSQYEKVATLRSQWRATTEKLDAVRKERLDHPESWNYSETIERGLLFFSNTVWAKGVKRNAAAALKIFGTSVHYLGLPPLAALAYTLGFPLDYLLPEAADPYLFQQMMGDVMQNPYLYGSTGWPVVGGVLSLVAAPLTSLAQFGLHQTLYDLDEPNPKHRTLNPLFKNMRRAGLAIKGAAVSVGGVAAATKIAGAGARMGWGYSRWAAKSAWQPVIVGWEKRFGLVPFEEPGSRNGLFYNRVAGLGVANTYFRELGKEEAVAVIIARGELEMLSLYDQIAKKAFRSPLDQLTRSVDFLRVVYGDDAGFALPKDSSAVEPFAKNVQENLKALDEAVTKRRKEILALLSLELPADRTQATGLGIKLTAANQKEALALSAAVLQAQFEREVFGRYLDEAGVARFWSERKLAKGDWIGLSARWLASVIGNEGMQPIEQTNASFRVASPPAGLSELLREVLSQTTDEVPASVSWAQVSLEEARPKVAPATVQNLFPAIGAESAVSCHLSLIAAASGGMGFEVGDIDWTQIGKK